MAASGKPPARMHRSNTWAAKMAPPHLLAKTDAASNAMADSGPQKLNENFLKSVMSLAKQIVIDSTQMVELTDQSITADRSNREREDASDAADSMKEAVINMAKKLAQATSQLTTLVKDNLVEETPNQNKLIQQDLLLSSTKAVQSAILDLIRATTDALDNPYDYYTVQKLSNGVHTVADAVKDTVAAVQALDNLFAAENDVAVAEANQRTNKICTAAKNAAMGIKAMMDTVKGSDKQEFIDSAKKAGMQLNELYKVARENIDDTALSNVFHNGEDRKFFAAAMELISIAKETFGNYGNQEARRNLEKARQDIVAQIRKLVLCVQSYWVVQEGNRSSTVSTSSTAAPVAIPPSDSEKSSEKKKDTAGAEATVSANRKQQSASETSPAKEISTTGERGQNTPSSVDNGDNEEADNSVITRTGVLIPKLKLSRTNSLTNILQSITEAEKKQLRKAPSNSPSATPTNSGTSASTSTNQTATAVLPQPRAVSALDMSALPITNLSTTATSAKASSTEQSATETSLPISSTNTPSPPITTQAQKTAETILSLLSNELPWFSANWASVKSDLRERVVKAIAAVVANGIAPLPANPVLTSSAPAVFGNRVPPLNLGAKSTTNVLPNSVAVSQPITLKALGGGKSALARLEESDELLVDGAGGAAAAAAGSANDGRPLDPEEDSARRELEEIIALQSFADWRRLSIRHRRNVSRVNPHFQPPPIITPRATAVGTLADLVTPLGDFVLEFIINAHAMLLDPRDAKTRQKLSSSVAGICNLVKKAVALAQCCSENVLHDVAVQKVCASVLAAMENGSMLPPSEGGSRHPQPYPPTGRVDDHTIAAASTGGWRTAKSVLYNLKKKTANESNRVRVLAIRLMAVINAKEKGTMRVAMEIVGACYSLRLAVEELLNTVATYTYIAQHRLADPPERSTAAGDVVVSTVAAPESDAKNDVNLWDELKTLTKLPKPKKVQRGSLNLLVATLTNPDNFDSQFLKTFVATYQSFTTPWTLFDKLMQRYNTPPDIQDAERVKLRVTVVFKYWIQMHHGDFDDELVRRIMGFIETLEKDGFKEAGALLKKELSSKFSKDVLAGGEAVVPSVNLTIPPSTMTPIELFMAMREEEIARQWCLISFANFAAIQPSELLNQAWNDVKLAYRSPNVVAMISRLNKVSHFIASLVTFTDRLKDRVEMVTKIIHVAEYLRQMNNYNTLMGVIAGMNISSVQRLKHTTASVNKKLYQNFKALEKLMSPQGSFKAYRAALHKSKGPTVPYLGVYLTDLTFMEDGNPDNIGSEVNFGKRILVHKVLEEIQLYQQQPYTFPIVEPIHTFLLELPTCGEKELYELSQHLEPRGADIKSIK